MNKKSYFRSFFRSTHLIEEIAVGIGLHLLSYPRLLLEVFIRRNFGERHFSFGKAIFATVLMIYISLLFRPSADLMAAYEPMNYYDGSEKAYYVGQFFLRQMSWYVFLGLFIIMCIRRQREINHLPSIFDFGRFSFYDGDIHSRFGEFIWNNKRPSIRVIETVLEPLFFFIIGIVLIVFQQNIGYVIAISSIGYCSYYCLCYYHGDQFMMDTIDKIIFTEEKSKVFFGGESETNARGVKFYGRTPTDPDNKRKVGEQFDDSEIVDVK